jgi:hypothetical protein
MLSFWIQNEGLSSLFCKYIDSVVIAFDLEIDLKKSLNFRLSG